MEMHFFSTGRRLGLECYIVQPWLGTGRASFLHADHKVPIPVPKIAFYCCPNERAGARIASCLRVARNFPADSVGQADFKSWGPFGHINSRDSSLHADASATDAKVFKKYSQMKLQMAREGLDKLNRNANEVRTGF